AQAEPSQTVTEFDSITALPVLPQLHGARVQMGRLRVPQARLGDDHAQGDGPRVGRLDVTQRGEGVRGLDGAGVGTARSDQPPAYLRGRGERFGPDEDSDLGTDRVERIVPNLEIENAVVHVILVE